MNELIYGTRITYTDSGIPNVLVTREVYMVDTSEGIKHYKGYIDTAKKTWLIRDEKTSDKAFEGSGSSPHKMKIKLKDALTKLGVKFSDEKRQPRKIVED